MYVGSYSKPELAHCCETLCSVGLASVLCVYQDTVIYERLVGVQPFKDATTQHLQDFAALGLICLLLGVFC